MEVYAGYSENTDWNIGAWFNAIEEMGDLENTLVIFIWGDNGASLEGTLTGTFNEWTMINGLPLTDEQQLQLVLKWGGLEAWGTEMMAPHYSAAWAWAGDCPFQWGKQVASHLGGTRNPMVVHWPQRITDRGELRSQFTHVTDVGPTILEAAGVPSRPASTACSSSPCTAPASPTRSATRAPPSGTDSSTSRFSATAGCTRTAGVAVVDDAAHAVEGRSGDDQGLRAGCLGFRERPGRALLPAG